MLKRCLPLVEFHKKTFLRRPCSGVSFVTIQQPSPPSTTITARRPNGPCRENYYLASIDVMPLLYSWGQCDQINRLLVQDLAIYNNEILLK